MSSEFTPAHLSGSTDYDPHQDTSGGTRTAGAGVLEREEQLQATEPGDHERFKHFVQKDKLTDAMVNGTPVVALCGKVWVPSRDPEKFPMCPACLEIYESLEPGGGKGDKGGGKSGGGRGFFGFGRGKN